MKTLKYAAIAGACAISFLTGYLVKRELIPSAIKNSCSLEQELGEEKFPFAIELEHAAPPNSHKIKKLRIFSKKDYADTLSLYKDIWFLIPEAGCSSRIRCSPDEGPPVVRAELEFSHPIDIHNYLALALGIMQGNHLETIALKKIKTR